MSEIAAETLKAERESFALAEAFTISRGTKTEAEVVTATVTRGAHVGRGECVPYRRYGETVESVLAQIESLPADVTRGRLAELLPSGAARNAVDCALWDLEAKVSGRPAWQLAGLDAPGPVLSVYTLSLDTPEAMAASAARHAEMPVLKIKLGTPEDLPRLEAVRAAAPQARLIVDANEGWSRETYLALVPGLLRLGIAMVEQPFPAGEDAVLAELPRPIPVGADESCHDRSSLAEMAGRYDYVNVKLDKTGGLTEALALRAEARAAGYGVMVGCMVGSSLAMAPAVLLAQGAEIVDLDGPLLLAEDRSEALYYDGAQVSPPRAELWG